MQIAATVLFVSAVIPVVPVVPGGLTVTAEIALYAVFPLLIAAIKNRIIAILSLILAIYVATRAYSPSVSILLRWGAENDLVGVFANFWLPYQLPVFLAGIAASHFGDLPLPRRILIAIFITGAAAMLLAPFVPEILPLHIEYALAFAGIVVCLANGVGCSIAIAPLRHLGKWSFSAYLLHFAVFNLLYLARSKGFDPFGLVEIGSPWRLLPLLASVLTLTSCAACFTYHAVERPMIELGNRLAAGLWRKRELREQIG